MATRLARKVATVERQTTHQRRRSPRGGACAAQWLAGAALAWGAFAFGAVYPWAYWPLAGACALREAHNDYLQLAIEGGLLLGVPITAAALTFAAAARRQLIATTDSTYWIRLGAVIGILAIAVQSVVEFSLQMPGNAALLAVLCAVALHRQVSPHTSPEYSSSGETAPADGPPPPARSLR